MTCATLVFVEWPDEVDVYLRVHPEAATDALFVALTLAARAHAQGRGLRVVSTESFTTTEVHRRISQLVEEHVSRVERAAIANDQEGWSDVYPQMASFYARFTPAYLLWLGEVIDAAVRFYVPTSIGAVFTPWESSGEPLLANTERFTGVLVARYASAHGLRVSLVAQPATLAARKRTAKQRRSLRLQWWSRRAQRMAARLFCAGYRRLHARGRPIIASFFGYKMEGVVASAIAHRKDAVALCLMESALSPWRACALAIANAIVINLGIASTFRALPYRVHGVLPLRLLEEIPTTRDEVFEASVTAMRLRMAEVFACACEVAGVSVADLVARKWEADIVPALCRLQRVGAGLARLWETRPPRVIFSPFSIDESALVGEWARLNAVPALLIPHGTFRPPRDIYDAMEFYRLGQGVIDTAYPTVAVQSPLEVAYASYYGIRSCVLVTEPLIWTVTPPQSAPVGDGALRQSLAIPPHARVVLHASTQKARNNLRTYINETADEYVAEIWDIWRAIEPLPDTVLVVKFRWKIDTSLEDLRAVLPKTPRVVVSTNDSLAALFSVAHCVVSYQSTVILEAILSGIPVVQYGGEGRYEHVAGARVAMADAGQLEAAYFAASLEELRATMAFVLSTIGRVPLEHPSVQRYRHPLHTTQSNGEWLDETFTV